MNVKIINKSSYEIPRYQTQGSAGVDLQANIEKPIVLQPLERTLIQTGIFLEIPTGYEAQVRPRSGLAYKQGISVLNSPGTIDSDYRGEIGVILVNLSNNQVEIKPAERIAQLVFAQVIQPKFTEVDLLTTTDRGKGGFGSTGT